MLARLQTLGRDSVSFAIILVLVAFVALIMAFGRSVCIAILGLFY